MKQEGVGTKALHPDAATPTLIHRTAPGAHASNKCDKDQRRGQSWRGQRGAHSHLGAITGREGPGVDNLTQFGGPGYLGGSDLLPDPKVSEEALRGVFRAAAPVRRPGGELHGCGPMGRGPCRALTQSPVPVSHSGRFVEDGAEETHVCVQRCGRGWWLSTGPRACVRRLHGFPRAEATTEFRVHLKLFFLVHGSPCSVGPASPVRQLRSGLSF